MRARRADLVGGGVLTALGLATVLLSLDYTLFAEDGRVAPGFMPFVSGALLALFGAAIMLQSVRAGRTHAAATQTVGEGDTSAPDPAPAEETPPESSSATREVAVVFGLMLVTVLLVPLLGFLVAFGALVFVLVSVVERRGVIPGLVLAVVSTLLTWLVFVRFLQIPLPGGLL